MADDKKVPFENHDERSPFLHGGNKNLVTEPLFPTAVEHQTATPTSQGGHQQYRDRANTITAMSTAPSGSCTQQENQTEVIYQPVVLPNSTPIASSSKDSISSPTDPLDARFPVRAREMGEPDKTIMVASGVTGALMGYLIRGPFLGVIAGFGSAYATEKPGAAGDIARAMGEIALITQEKAKKIDHDHQIVDKSKTALADAWERAKELDQQHRMVDRVKEFAAFSWRETLEFTRRHRLLEKGAETFGHGFEWISNKLCGESEGVALERRSVPLDISPAKPH